MRQHPNLPLALLKEILHYNPSSGDFTWRKRMSSSAPEGAIAGTIHPRNKRRYIKIKGRLYFASRLAAYYMTGEWPDGLQVDHINRDRDDNRWSNLRIVTNAQNQWNTAAKVTNKLGKKNIHFDKRLQKYIACIRVGGSTKHLGCYKTIDEAIAARNAAAMMVHGEFAAESPDLT